MESGFAVQPGELQRIPHDRGTHPEENQQTSPTQLTAGTVDRPFVELALPRSRCDDVARRRRAGGMVPSDVLELLVLWVETNTGHSGRGDRGDRVGSAVRRLCHRKNRRGVAFTAGVI